MTGKEALNRIGHLEYGCDYLEKSTPLKVSGEYKTIEKELDELTKYKRAFEILKPIINMDNNIEESGKEYWLSDIWGLRKLTKEEYELLEELINNESR